MIYAVYNLLIELSETKNVFQRNIKVYSTLFIICIEDSFIFESQRVIINPAKTRLFIKRTLIRTNSLKGPESDSDKFFCQSNSKKCNYSLRDTCFFDKAAKAAGAARFSVSAR